MKVRKRSYTVFFTVISSVLALIVTVAGIIAYNTSTVTFEYETGTISNTRTVFVGNLNRKETSFEDSKIFAEAYMDTIYDITRMCVIRNQMETDGTYDANKETDIVRFANRYRYSPGTDGVTDISQGSPKSTYTAEAKGNSVKYRLDDLINWGSYGFDMIPVTGTSAQLDAYFYSLINGVDIDNMAAANETEHYEAGYVTDMLDELGTYSHSEEDVYTEYVLVERYKPIGNKSIISYVSNRKEYRELVKDLVKSAVDLFNNYDEYVDYLDRYGNGSGTPTNMMYCYQMKDAAGKNVRYSNLISDVDRMSNDELTRLFSGQVKYVCFNPDKLQTATNIDGVTSSFMKSAMNGYEYSFGEGSRIWLGFDGEYTADDMFAKLKNDYNKSGALLMPTLVTGITALIAYIVLLVVMTVQAGKVVIIEESGEKHDAVRPAKADHINTELYILITAIICGLAIGALISVFYEGIWRFGYYGLNESMTYIICGGAVVLCNSVLIPLYLMLVRKIKCRLMWNCSLLKWITRKVKGGVTDLYDNGHLTIRFWLPYLIFLALNLVLVMLGIAGIIVAFIFDIAIGIWLYNEAKIRNGIVAGISRISDGELTHKVDTSRMHGDNLALANAVNNIGDGISKAVDISMRDEKMKADLITNVSHDIKTPLTSIINYVDLLKRENIEDEKIKGYVDVLDQKSQRLKQLTDDLVEASKISSGNITLNIEKINFVELIHQSIGEFSEKFEQRGLKTMLRLPGEPVYIMADSRGIYRVVENLYNNVYKYAMENTRVYVDMEPDGEGRVTLAVKNISAEVLNISAGELTERFMRGDESRRTEGSGLGLSIAKSLTEAMGGSFDISLDGDLFKVVIGFKPVQG